MSRPRLLRRTVAACVAALSCSALAPAGAAGAAAVTAAPVTAAPAAAAPAAARSSADRPAYPVVASPDGRRLLTSDGRAFPYVADTPWLAIAELDQAGLRALFDARRAQGFTTLQVLVLGMPHRGSLANAYGDLPLHGTDLSRPWVAGGRTADPGSPDYDYWDHVEYAVDQAAARGLQLTLVPSWYGYAGEDWRGHLTESRARAYGTFLGRRLGGERNITWLLGGDNDPVGDTGKVPGGLRTGSVVGATDAMATAIRSTETVRHLMSYHAKRRVSSARYFDDRPWHTFYSAYSDELSYEYVAAGWRNTPVRPVVLTEAYYDGRAALGRSPVLDRQRLRAQSYWTVLSGGAGVAYGHERVWDLDADWKRALQAASASDVHRMTTLLDDPGVQALRPDLGEVRMLARGYGEGGTRERAASARTPDRRLGVAYLPDARPVTLDASAFAGTVRLTWWDPATGSSRDAGTWKPSTGDKRMTYPFGSDAVLIARSG